MLKKLCHLFVTNYYDLVLSWFICNYMYNVNILNLIVFKYISALKYGVLQFLKEDKQILSNSTQEQRKALFDNVINTCHIGYLNLYIPINADGLF